MRRIERAEARPMASNVGRKKMPALDRSVATLRVKGDDLRPEEITRLLGCSPTKSQLKDEVIKHPKSGKERIARIGMWSLDAEDRVPSDPDAQVAELLTKLSSDLDIWRSITTSFRVDVFFGLFMKEWNEGLSLAPATMVALGSRGIEADFDIYGPFPEESNTGRQATASPSPAT